jgi:hypothetical protein
VANLEKAARAGASNEQFICLLNGRLYRKLRRIDHGEGSNLPELLSIGRMGFDRVRFNASETTDFCERGHVNLHRRPQDFAAVALDETPEMVHFGLPVVIAGKLDGDPHVSAKKFAQSLGIAASAVCRCLTEVLGMNCRHLHWVPHTLTPAQKVMHT